MIRILLDTSDLEVGGSGHLRPDKELIRSIGPWEQHTYHYHHHHHHDRHFEYPPHDKDDVVRRQMVRSCLILAHWARELLTQHPLENMMMMMMMMEVMMTTTMMMIMMRPHEVIAQDSPGTLMWLWTKSSDFTEALTSQNWDGVIEPVAHYG